VEAVRLFLALWLLIAPVFAQASAPVPILFKAAPYVLDQLSSYPAVAYSVRQMTGGQYLPNYDMTVRRSSDNATQNIGFLGGILNTAQLISFCAATNCYVVTLKDQGSLGASGDATQSTAASQPQIVASGVVETWNNQPAVYFGGSQYLATAGNVQVVNATTGVWSAAAVGNTGLATNIPIVAQDNSPRIWDLRSNGNLNRTFSIFFNTASGSFSATSAVYPGNIFQGIFGGSQVSVYSNGAYGGISSVLSGTSQTLAVALSIGFSPGASTFWTGTISEAWAGGFVQSTTDKATYDLNAASCSATGFCIPGVTQ
jgi:hypothetical protein